MEYEKEFVLFFEKVGVVCNYENRNTTSGFSGKPSPPSVMQEDTFSMGSSIITVYLCYCIAAYF